MGEFLKDLVKNLKKILKKKKKTNDNKLILTKFKYNSLKILEKSDKILGKIFGKFWSKKKIIRYCLYNTSLRVSQNLTPPLFAIF